MVHGMLLVGVTPLVYAYPPLSLVVGVLIFIIGVFMNSGTVRGWLFTEVKYHVNELGAIFSAWIAPAVLIFGSLVTVSALFNKF